MSVEEDLLTEIDLALELPFGGQAEVDAEVLELLSRLEGGPFSEPAQVAKSFYQGLSTIYPQEHPRLWDYRWKGFERALDEMHAKACCNC